MELDWSTFALEVINFLILMWLLKRFLYQPVLNVIEKRRQKIAAELARAAGEQEEARALKSQYETRLADWEQEKRAAAGVLEQQLDRERGTRLQQLDAELEQQRRKHLVRDQQQQALWRSQAEEEALQLGAAFAARLLQDLAGAELDRRLQQLFIDQLAAPPGSALGELQTGWRDATAGIQVASAMPLDAARQQAIRQALEQKLGPGGGPWQFTQDDKLIAGLRVSIGSWIAHANLQDELRFFSAAAHDG